MGVEGHISASCLAHLNPKWGGGALSPLVLGQSQDRYYQKDFLFLSYSYSSLWAWGNSQKLLFFGVCGEIILSVYVGLGRKLLKCPEQDTWKTIRRTREHAACHAILESQGPYANFLLQRIPIFLWLWDFFFLFLVVQGETLKEYIILARTRSNEKSPMAYLCNWIIKSRSISSHVTVIIFRVSIPPWHNYEPVFRWLDFCIICLQQYISPPPFEPSFPDNGKL